MRLLTPQPLLREFEGLSWLGEGTSLLYPFVFLTFEGVRSEALCAFSCSLPWLLVFLLPQRRCFRKQSGLQCYMPDVSQQIPPRILAVRVDGWKASAGQLRAPEVTSLVIAGL